MHTAPFATNVTHITIYLQVNYGDSGTRLHVNSQEPSRLPGVAKQ